MNVEVRTERIRRGSFLSIFRCGIAKCVIIVISKILAVCSIAKHNVYCH